MVMGAVQTVENSVISYLMRIKTYFSLLKIILKKDEKG